MAQQKQQRLIFYAKGQQNLKKTLGKKKPLNPSYLITPTTSKPNQNQSSKGKFYYDHLISDEETSKAKGIKKPQKRKNYKTKMCPHGRDCRHKFSCTFAHNQKELRKPFLKRTKPCKMYQMGQCQLGAACRQYHGNIDLMKKNYKYKSEYCKQFIAKGKCQLDRVCIYIHELPPKQPQDGQEAELDSQSQQNNISKEQQPVQPCQPMKQQTPKPQLLKSGKQIVQVVEQKLGAEQVVEGGLSFNFMF